MEYHSAWDSCSGYSSLSVVPSGPDDLTNRQDPGHFVPSEIVSFYLITTGLTDLIVLGVGR